MHRHGEVFFLLGGGGGGDRIDRPVFLGARLRNHQFSTAGGAINYRPRSRRVHREFLVAVGAIKNDVHSARFLSRSGIGDDAQQPKFLPAKMPAKNANRVRAARAVDKVRNWSVAQIAVNFL